VSDDVAFKLAISVIAFGGFTLALMAHRRITDLCHIIQDLLAFLQKGTPND
jgi:hypothetical protein